MKNLGGKRTPFTIDSFIARAKAIHVDPSYDYNKVIYVNAHTKVTLICKHGEFQITPGNHINHLHGCTKCNREKKMGKELILFKEEANRVHNNKYGYDEVVFVNMKMSVKIWCPVHQLYFNQVPYEHVDAGYGCWICGVEKRAESRRKSLEDFIKEIKERFEDNYDCTLIKYVNAHTRVQLKCTIHKILFEITPHSLLRKGRTGCPHCASATYSKIAIRWLNHIATKLKIHIQHAKNGGEHKIGPYKADGYCQATNTIYEFYGDFWHGSPLIYDPCDINPRNHKSFGDLYTATLVKEIYIKSQGYNLITIWERDWVKQEKRLAAT